MRVPPVSTANELGIAEGIALGCGLRVVVTRPDRLPLVKRSVDDVLEAVDKACSRFRADSEITAVNARPERETKLSALLTRALTVALEAARTTQGAVDPTIGSAIRLLGYDRDFAVLPADGGPLRLIAKRMPTWQSLRFNADRGLLWLPRGVELDLGATAKALAADLAAAAALATAGVGGVLVSLGGDIAVAGEAPSGGWRIQVSEDSRASISESEEAVAISAGGLATSSTTVRRWRRGGVELHHILDPATGLPARGPFRTVTVAAPTCVEANTAATAAIVLGESAIEWLEVTRLPARLVHGGGAVRRVAGWPKPARPQS